MLLRDRQGQQPKRRVCPGLCACVLCREALALYREILRYSNLLVWKDAKGNMWRDVIRASARKVSGNPLQ